MRMILISNEGAQANDLTASVGMRAQGLTPMWLCGRWGRRGSVDAHARGLCGVGATYCRYARHPLPTTQTQCQQANASKTHQNALGGAQVIR
jgi:hypothetical protein